MSVFREKYKVNYCGKKFEYKNARDEYRAGENVTLYYSMIATDTDYFFSLDGDKENRISDLINAKQRSPEIQTYASSQTVRITLQSGLFDRYY